MLHTQRKTTRSDWRGLTIAETVHIFIIHKCFSWSSRKLLKVKIFCLFFHASWFNHVECVPWIKQYVSVFRAPNKKKKTITIFFRRQTEKTIFHEQFVDIDENPFKCGSITYSNHRAHWLSEFFEYRSKPIYRDALWLEFFLCVNTKRRTTRYCK